MAAKKKTEQYISHLKQVRLSDATEKDYGHSRNRYIPPASAKPSFSTIFSVGAACCHSARELPISNLQTFPITSPAISNILHHQSFKIILKSFHSPTRRSAHIGAIKLRFGSKAGKDIASVATFYVSLKPI